MVTNDYCDVVPVLTLTVMLPPGLAGANPAYKYDMPSQSTKKVARSLCGLEAGIIVAGKKMLQVLLMQPPSVWLIMVKVVNLLLCQERWSSPLKACTGNRGILDDGEVVGGQARVLAWKCSYEQWHFAGGSSVGGLLAGREGREGCRAVTESGVGHAGRNTGRTERDEAVGAAGQHVQKRVNCQAEEHNWSADAEDTFLQGGFVAAEEVEVKSWGQAEDCRDRGLGASGEVGGMTRRGGKGVEVELQVVPTSVRVVALHVAADQGSQMVVGHKHVTLGWHEMWMGKGAGM
ncbi:hypothetical protein B0H14DRAFT_2633774 [Mycena olivaceomarginata]|nr:hypothetical protein B0H14DRAFT_2633774 [Mycena olivaceomarginata]